MAGYQPLKVAGMETGLVQSRENFLLPADAYPVIENAFVWRERIKRKQGFQYLGRLQRNFTGLTGLGNSTAGATMIFPNILNTLGFTQTNASIVPGSIFIAAAGPGPDTFSFTDDGDGTFAVTGQGDATGSSINYSTGAVTLNFSPALVGGAQIFINIQYYPCLPVMGIRLRELDSVNIEETIIFDQTYAYRYNGPLGLFEEFIPGTTWSGSDSDFFWSTNYWQTATAPFKKLFWVTNFFASDPIRYTDGTTWTNFSPVINAAGDLLTQCLAMLPFRGRLVVFNTIEAGGGVYYNRIRWSQIGNPLLIDSWRDDIRGKGGFLDIPTSQAIVSVGFVRDNLVIYCERSTWQLRYTGRSIAPFQIEKVNSELGAESTFSAIQFDTSLVGIGDKGIVECDSFKSERIDIKIPDLIFEFNNQDEGPKRIQGIRDFTQRLAYWIYPLADTGAKFPDRRLVYNYENDSWAIFTDSLTALGTFQPPTTRTWENTNLSWQECNFTWGNEPANIPAIIGGNQQGYIEYIGGGIEGGQTTNDQSLYIKNIVGFGTTLTDNPVLVTSPSHNMVTGTIIQIIDIPLGTPFYTELNDNIFMITTVSGSSDDFYLTYYDALTEQFSSPQLAPSSYVYIGGGQIKVRDNFRIVSKKFSYMDEGKQYQLGYIDILMDTTANGAITMNVYTDYNDSEPSNTNPGNAVDSFFNSTIPTFPEGQSLVGGNKNWHRAFCATNANFVTIEYTLSNEQMQNQCQESDVQIDAQIIWSRIGGRLGLVS